MGGSSSTSKETRRYAPYIESAHSRFLADMALNTNAALAGNPYDGYAFDSIDTEFFGIGYVLSSYPSLFDMFGKFLSGLDIEELWQKAVDTILTPDEIKKNIQEKSTALNQKVDIETLPKHQREMRDLNAVNTSTYCVGKSVIEDNRIKELSKISLEETAKLLPEVENNWLQHLNHNLETVKRYAMIMRDYVSSRVTTDEAHYHMAVEGALWPFTVLEYERKGLFALAPNTAIAAKQQTNFSQTTAGRVVTIVSWTATGVYYGSEFGPWGALIGGVIGLIVGLADAFLLS